MASVHREGETQLKCSDYTGPERRRSWRSNRRARMQTHTRTHAHTRHLKWVCVFFPHAALWEEKMRDARMRKEESGDADDGGLPTTYRKRYSSLVSDSDSVRGTVIVWGRRWGEEERDEECGGERERKEREGKQVRAPVMWLRDFQGGERECDGEGQHPGRGRVAFRSISTHPGFVVESSIPTCLD